ncbi:hypothetical protein M5689_011621 [Euphorbia peplus]|nr:hypothetical protein M5689_011621 [Euphorbia peplus]
MGDRLIGLMISALALTLILILEGSVANGATTFTVGDSLGWTVPPNNSMDYYQNWAANHTFLIGDSLLFNWTGTHTATEVSNEEEYANCTKMGIILATSEVSALLSENGTRYFVCSVGTHCEQGMKVAVKVGNGIPPPPPPSAAPSLHIASLAATLISSIAILFFTHA